MRGATRVVRSLLFLCLLVVGCLLGRGSPDRGVPFRILGFDHALSWLRWSKQGSTPSTTSSMNKPWTACCSPTFYAFVLYRLPLAVHGGEGKGMMETMVVRSGGGGSTSTLVRGRDTRRRLASSSSSVPSPAGRGG
jgi:hypothetical protein